MQAQQRKATTTVAVCIVLLLLLQQVNAGPLVLKLRSRDGLGDQRVLRRVARMSPLWRIMNSKPFGAYCQNNYECSTGLCRAGQCSHNNQSETVNN
ncbi:liver-expressed antimicrobial peptide 2 [Gouania willdenowi]|uniref:Liver-expressed antimicrobial peptide 2 n=1 Tax=Gouania willdenowi TaxID=441366 RepID=A0A8C5EU94_GOUWI|nr:liver-expressed antimicrobial peptide 2 [Gouania willdenowi]